MCIGKAVEKQEKINYKYFLYSTEMGRKALNFNGVEINKRKFHTSKQPINLDSVNFNKIIMSAKVKHGDKSFKYSIGYINGDIVKP